MYDLLKSAIQTKYKMPRSKVLELIDTAEKDGTLGDWYEIAILKLREEKQKSVKV